jgi:hypothetical protein
MDYGRNMANCGLETGALYESKSHKMDYGRNMANCGLGTEARPRSNCTVNYRPVLSSERVPHIKKPAIVRQKTRIWSWAPDGTPTPRQTGRLTVGRKLTSLHYIGLHWTDISLHSTECSWLVSSHMDKHLLTDMHTAPFTLQFWAVYSCITQLVGREFWKTIIDPHWPSRLRRYWPNDLLTRLQHIFVIVVLFVSSSL